MAGEEEVEEVEEVLVTDCPSRGEEDWSEDWEEVERQEETELIVWPPPLPWH